MKQESPALNFRVAVTLKMHIKQLILKSLSLVHVGITTRTIKVLQQSIGFGYDSGIENEVNLFIKEVRKFRLANPILLDVGANVGSWSKLVSSRLVNCEIHAFEPSMETFLELEKFAKSVSNVHIHNFGCGEEDSSRYLFYDELKSGKASLSKRDLKHLGIEFEKFESL